MPTAKLSCYRGWRQLFPGDGGSHASFTLTGVRPAVAKSVILVKRRRSLTRKAALAAKPRLYHSLCLPAGVPSDQFVTATKDTRIGGSPFIWGCSFGEKNQ